MGDGLEWVRGWEVVVAHALIDESSCDEWVERAEEVGFEMGPIFTEEGERVAIHIRDCLEAVFEDEEAADLLTEALAARFVGSPWLDGFVGAHPRLRVFRYSEGQAFAPHTDAHIDADDGVSRSEVTMLLYLNDDFGGGETAFPDGWDDGQIVTPRKGSVLCFEHDLLHEGRAITSGVKYVLRADLLFDAPR